MLRSTISQMCPRPSTHLAFVRNELRNSHSCPAPAGLFPKETTTVENEMSGARAASQRTIWISASLGFGIRSVGRARTNGVSSAD